MWSTMSGKDWELECRLDDLLSRIAMETQEIRELGQQLTRGPVLANDALRCGHQPVPQGDLVVLQQQILALQAENQTLQRLLEDARGHCRQLEEPGVSEGVQESRCQQEALSALWAETQALRDRQAQLEAELQQMREELIHQVTPGGLDPMEPEPEVTQMDSVCQRLRVQLDQSRSQFSRTRTRLERVTADLSELQENQREQQHKASSELSGTNRENWTSRQKLQPGRDQNCDRTLHRSQSRTRTLQPNRSAELAPSLASQGTQDSGLGLQYLSSPDRGRHQEGRPAGGETPPDPSWLLCDPPAGGAAPHRSVPGHRDAEARCSHRPEEEKKKKRRSLRRHRRVLQVCDELECLEATLRRRRAELRHADRLLLEAQSCRRTARRNAHRLQHRLEDSASCLLEATQHLRELQEEAEQLRRRREEEEWRLREVEEKLRWRREERRRLEEQCRHLEARRRNSNRGRSALEAELAKQREELGPAQFFKKGVVREARANQQQLSRMTSSAVCSLSED